MAARRREAHGVFRLLGSNYPFEAGHRLLALLLQRKSAYAEAAEYWRRYLATDHASEMGGARDARRSLLSFALPKI